MGNLILVGFMGTGKSTVGKILADRLGWRFLDLDRQIERQAGRSIPKIFSEEGEYGFRQREARAVQDLAGLDSTVIAAGGGVMGQERNVRVLKAAGPVVCLTASPDVILERTRRMLTGRPLLSGGDPKERIQELLALRASSYARADFTIDTTSRSPAEVAEEVLKSVRLP